MRCNGKITEDILVDGLRKEAKEKRKRGVAKEKRKRRRVVVARLDSVGVLSCTP
jgi:hypothetical protein